MSSVGKPSDEDDRLHAIDRARPVALLRDCPDIKADAVIDYGLTDIVAERSDAGVRLGEQAANDIADLAGWVVRRRLNVAMSSVSPVNTRSDNR